MAGLWSGITQGEWSDDPNQNAVGQQGALGAAAYLLDTQGKTGGQLMSGALQGYMGGTMAERGMQVKERAVEQNKNLAKSDLAFKIQENARFLLKAEQEAWHETNRRLVASDQPPLDPATMPTIDKAFAKSLQMFGQSTTTGVTPGMGRPGPQPPPAAPIVPPPVSAPQTPTENAPGAPPGLLVPSDPGLTPNPDARGEAAVPPDMGTLFNPTTPSGLTPAGQAQVQARNGRQPPPLTPKQSAGLELRRGQIEGQTGMGPEVSPAQAAGVAEPPLQMAQAGGPTDAGQPGVLPGAGRGNPALLTAPAAGPTAANVGLQELIKRHNRFELQRQLGHHDKTSVDVFQATTPKLPEGMWWNSKTNSYEMAPGIVGGVGALEASKKASDAVTFLTPDGGKSQTSRAKFEQLNALNRELGLPLLQTDMSPQRRVEQERNPLLREMPAATAGGQPTVTTEGNIRARLAGGAGAAPGAPGAAPGAPGAPGVGGIPIGRSADDIKWGERKAADYTKARDTFAKEHTAHKEAAAAASTMRDRMTAMKLNLPADTGKMPAFLQTYKEWGMSMGMLTEKQAKETTKGATFESISADMLVGLQERFKGAVSNAEGETAKRTVPTLGSPRKTNEFLIDSANAMAGKQLWYAQRMAAIDNERYAAENRGEEFNISKAINDLNALRDSPATSIYNSKAWKAKWGDTVKTEATQ